MKDLTAAMRRVIPAARQKRESAMLGLSFDTGRVEVVELRRTNGSAQVLRSVSVPLTLDPLNNDPELVGRELLNGLTSAGVRTRRCVVVLPLKWALITQTQVPPLPEEDIPGFLEVEADRNFPCDPATLSLASSRTRPTASGSHGLLVGVPRNHLAALEKALKAAQLRPVSFSLALPALESAALNANQGVLALLVGQTSLDLLIAADGGIVALRSLEAGLETGSGHQRVSADLIGRELRITLGQLPAELRAKLTQARIYGPPDICQALADELEMRFENLGLEIEVVQKYTAGALSLTIPTDAPVSPALNVAVRALAGVPPTFEFLPPRVSTWDHYFARYSSGKLQRVAIAAAAVVTLVLAAFAFQQVQIWRLESQWSSIRKAAGELKTMQQAYSRFQPWQDNSLRSLNILKRVTEAFPEDGTVTAKILEIREAKTVSCTGVARDYAALLKTVERLRTIPEIPDVSVGPTRGQSPALQFTISFAWEPGGKRGN